MEVTPFQTVGPFFEVLLRSRVPQPPPGNAAPGTPAVITGVLYDGAGQPIPDGLVELWQADPPHHRWSATADDGRFQFEIVRPAAVDGPQGRPQAPHLIIGVMARGILTRYITRAYFEDERANDSDPILTLVPAERRRTLIAARVGHNEYRFDIRVQGPGETVFFDT